MKTRRRNVRKLTSVIKEVTEAGGRTSVTHEFHCLEVNIMNTGNGQL